MSRNAHSKSGVSLRDIQKTAVKDYTQTSDVNRGEQSDENEKLSQIKSIVINPLTPMSDQDRISPYNINATSTRQVMRITKTINLGIMS